MGTYTQFAAKVIRANGHGKPVAYRVSGTGKWAIALPSTVGLHDPLRDRIATVFKCAAYARQLNKREHRKCTLNHSAG